MKINAIITENFKLDGGACFGVVPKTIWQKHYPADENNLITLVNRCLLVETNQKLILMDTGIGNKYDSEFLKHYYLEPFGLENEINKKGYSVNDITDVILTHLHFDHVGGAVSKKNNELKITCPNATYWVSQDQFNWANRPNNREKSSYHTFNWELLVKNNRLKLIDKWHSLNKESELVYNVDFDDNITLFQVNGHTKGQIAVSINYKERKLVYGGDFIPTKANIPIHYVAGYDINPLKTMDEKHEFLNQAFLENIILIFDHDIYNECATLLQSDKGIIAGNSLSLGSI